MLLSKLPESCYIVVDNTWLTAELFNPFDVGAHIIVESCSKYVSGGRCISGAAAFKLSNDYATKKTTSFVKCGGIHLSPTYCDFVRTGIGELSSTMELLNTKTQAMVQFLLEQPNVLQVDYPTLPTHKTYSIYQKYVGVKGPGVIWFKVAFNCNDKSWRNKFKTIVTSSGIDLSTSFCKSYSLIDSWPKGKGSSIWLRMSLGYSNEPGLNSKIAKMMAKF